MPIEPPNIDAAKLAAATGGALISARYLPGSPIQRLLMVCGGAALSYVASSPVAEWLKVAPNAYGLVGFLIGMFGIVIANKVYEGIQSIDATTVIQDAIDWFKRK